MSFSLSVRWLIETPQVTASPAALARRIDVERLGAGDLGGVVAAAGQRGEAEVALEHDDLGLARDAGEAEPGRDLALVHDAGADEVGSAAWCMIERAEIAGIGQRAAHHGGVGDRVAAVGEGDGAGLAQQAELGHLLAGEALGERRRRDRRAPRPCRGRGGR